MFGRKRCVQSGDPSWATLAPPDVAKLIRERNLFQVETGPRTQ